VAAGTLRIGLIVSRRGPAGLWAATCDACTMLAAAEVNATGGVPGRRVEVVPADAGMLESEAWSAARDLVEVEDVDAVIGMHPSNVRGAIARGIAGRTPYVYSPMYEGGELRRDVLPIGATDDELLGYAIPVLMERRRVRRFFLLGNDYVWPRRAALVAARMIAQHGGRVVGMSMQRFGIEDYSEVFAKILHSSADMVVTMLLGEEAVRFNRAFAAAGLAGRVLRLGLAVDETVLYGAGADAHENLYVATSFVAARPARHSERFIELYRDNFGSAVPPATVFGQSCYDGVHLLAGLARSGRRPDAEALRRGFSRLASRRPGRLALPETLMAAAAQIHLAQAEGLELTVVASR
jgi:urea transport system substrate-binding protein